MGGTHPAGSSREEQECKNPQKRCQSTLGRAAIWFLRKPEAPVHYQVPDGLGLKVGEGQNAAEKTLERIELRVPGHAHLLSFQEVGHLGISRSAES